MVITSVLEAKSSRRRDTRTRLEGNEFFLDIDYTSVNFTGKRAIATTVNGQIPGPTLVWKEGQTVTIHVTNHLKKSTSIHWHGIILPAPMDGVPGISFQGIPPGKTFTYRFKVRQHGTYWYHSHSGYQEQTGLYGAIVIEAKKKEPFRYDRDYVVLLSDWSDEKPISIYRKLKLSSDYYNFNQRTVGDFFSEAKKKGFGKAFSDRKMWNTMRMSDRDLSDVTGYTYTYLMNGNNPTTQFRALFKKGEKIRLRFINGAAMSFFDLRIPGLKMTIVAADGNHIKPVSVDEFRIGVAETYDVIVEPGSSKAYAIFAQSIERSGYAMGSLTPSDTQLAKAPKMDKPQALTMADMGMKMDMKKDQGKKMSMKMPMKKYRWKAMEAEKYPITKLPMARGAQSTMMAMNPKYRLDDPGVGLRNNGRRVLTYADLKNRYSTRRERRPDREIILTSDRPIWSAICGRSTGSSMPMPSRWSFTTANGCASPSSMIR